MLKYAKKWKILHNNRKQSMERFMNELEKKRIFYKEDHEMLELIQMALKRPEIYNKRIYKKIPLFYGSIKWKKVKICLYHVSGVHNDENQKKRKIRFCTKLATNHVKKQNII